MLFFAFGIVSLSDVWVCCLVRPTQPVDANRGQVGQPILRLLSCATVIHLGILLSPFVPLNGEPDWS